MNYYSHFDSKKIKMDFLCNTKVVAYEDEIKKLGGNIYRIAMRSKDPVQYRKDLKSFFKEYGNTYDAVWVNVCSLANIDYLKYAKKAGIPIRIIHSHNSQNMDSLLRGILHRWNRLLLPYYANYFWSCSEDSSHWFYSPSLLNTDRYLLVNNAIDLKQYDYNSQIRRAVRSRFSVNENFVVGHVGRLHFQKNQKFLLEIFSQVVKKRPEARLWLIGQGEDERVLKERAKELGIEDKTIFFGLREDIAELLQAMDAFVFPSLFEGLPLSLLEAQASGLPVFASKNVISPRAKVTNTFYSLDLNDSPQKWADSILKNSGTRKAANSLDIEEAGYSIDKEAIKLQERLLDLQKKPT